MSSPPRNAFVCITVLVASSTLSKSPLPMLNPHAPSQVVPHWASAQLRPVAVELSESSNARWKCGSQLGHTEYGAATYKDDEPVSRCTRNGRGGVPTSIVAEYTPCSSRRSTVRSRRLETTEPRSRPSFCASACCCGACARGLPVRVWVRGTSNPAAACAAAATTSATPRHPPGIAAGGPQPHCPTRWGLVGRRRALTLVKSTVSRWPHTAGGLNPTERERGPLQDAITAVCPVVLAAVLCKAALAAWSPLLSPSGGTKKDPGRRRQKG